MAGDEGAGSAGNGSRPGEYAQRPVEVNITQKVFNGLVLAVLGGVVGVLGLLIGLGLDKWIADRIEARVDPLPKDALLAFLNACPDGWENAVTDEIASQGPYLRLHTANRPAKGGQSAITLEEAHIPKLGLRSNNILFKDGISMHIGPDGSQIPRYSFIDKSGGVGGLLSINMKEIFIGTENPRAIALEPTYQAIFLCARKPDRTAG